MACGTVPIYGNNSAMLELIGDYGLPADPDDVESIATAMKKLLIDSDLRSRMEHSAYEYSEKSSIERFGMKMTSLYNEIIENKANSEW